MKISIIVPVYNAESTLTRCLDCIVGQTYTNLEILLINDGSTDQSGKICEEYAARDERVRYFNRKNQGVSAVREFGTKQVTGTYFIHFDSDDWAHSQMIADMADEAIKQNADVLISDFYIDTSMGVVYSKQQPAKLQSLQVLHNILSGSLHGSTCNKLVRTSLYRSYDVHFPRGLNYCEDIMIWVELLQHDVKIGYLPKAFYHYDYTINSNSITRSYTRETLRQRLAYIALLESSLNKDGYASDILHNKLCVKFEAFEKGELLSKDFKAIYPEINKHIFKMNTSLMNRILLYFASVGLTCIAQKIYKIKTKRNLL